MNIDKLSCTKQLSFTSETPFCPVVETISVPLSLCCFPVEFQGFLKSRNFCGTEDGDGGPCGLDSPLSMLPGPYSFLIFSHGSVKVTPDTCLIPSHEALQVWLPLN